MELLIVPLLTFITVLLFVVALASPEGKNLEERLRLYGQQAITEQEKRLAQPFHVRVLYPLIARLGRLAISLTPGHVRARAEQRLAQAGYPSSLSVDSLLILKLTLAALLPALYAASLMAGHQSVGPMQLAFLLALCYIGNRLPDIWLSRQIRLRQARIEENLPDALDLITVCVEAGYGLDAALAKVVEKTKGPLSEEFERTLQEINVGKARRQALRDLGLRVGVPDLSAFVAAIVQADQMGVSIAQVLRVHADNMRVRRRQRAEEKAIQAPIKMLFPLVFLVFPALFVVILGPAALSIMQYFGRMGG